MSATPPTSPWIAFDPHHSPPRAWTINGDQLNVAATEVSDLDAALALAPGAPLITCGAEGAQAVPVPAKPADLPARATAHASGRVRSMPPLSQAQPDLRLTGSVCRIDGFLSLNPSWDGVICVPGPVATDWVLISASEIVSFVSFASWPMIASMCPAAQPGDAADVAALTEPLQDVLSKPETLALRLAEIRSQQAAARLSDAAALGRTWGAVLGAELAAARSYWLGQNMALIATPDFAAPYLKAFESQYIPVTQADEARMTLAGLVRAYHRTT
ncbi:2-dehydro-3-deoxygalactonokinase [Epibacterium sp. MM17-32]|uniref:2-dehydro-3-deoxygalactonokinase n=1 Tax=Epibacterium sp. MM17-32 TaxID=2917734 RepID=UPI001EF49137|nr:2-dehydro-3-deoxygalactonokinase [Epibacterium sp. MM17-32]MCG7628915.1 2-dehydro-3-deoxygalactonokinase [Epibacterium sp. MM17-32]